MSRVEGYDKGYHIMSAHELVMRISDTSRLWTTKELATLESALRKAVIREASVEAEDTEAYKKMAVKYVYWKGRYEMAVRGMADEAAIEIMGKEP